MLIEQTHELKSEYDDALYGRQCGSVSCWMDCEKICTDIRGLQRINPTNFGDPLSFTLAPPWPLCLITTSQSCQHGCKVDTK